jgi:D-threonate/D-erythronate kinase
LSADPARWLFVADDLTGACDVVAPFAPATVFLGLFPPVGYDPQVAKLRFDGDSAESCVSVCAPVRSAGALLAESAVRSVLAALAKTENGRRRRAFVKVDSAGRSPYAEMVRAASSVGRPVVCPAFPAHGRTVVDGWICVDGGKVFDLRSAVGESGEVVDAVDDEDLARLADRIRRDSGAVPVGSSGLAGALARGGPVRGPSASNRSASNRQRFDGPVMVVVGSRHEAARSQVSAVESVAEVLKSAADDRIDALTELVDRVESRFDGHALVLTGGDTALAVLQRLGVTRLRIDIESERGVPIGLALDGRAAGRPISLKSGGFGDSGTLERMVLAVSPESSVSSNRDDVEARRFDAHGLKT